LVSQQPSKQAVAENWLSKAVDDFEQAGAIEDLSVFSEGFSAYCHALASRLGLYANASKADLIVADMHKINNSCVPALDKYPWDVYLRWAIIGANNFAGQGLAGMGHYEDALPYLQYGSHWVNVESSKTLARLYREGLGVQKDLKKANELEVKAQNQKGMKRFTIPCDFGGQKAPFAFYVLDWPADYPFEGIDDQVQWLKVARSGVAPQDAVEAFRAVWKIAKEKNVSFKDLAVSALGKTDTIKQ
jgi:TPR repeat protein